MNAGFRNRFAALRGARCTEVVGRDVEAPPGDAIYAVITELTFSDGTWMSAQLWRLIGPDATNVSIFDHRQRYGLPAPIDAVRVLRDALVGRAVDAASVDATTGDLDVALDGGWRLQAFNVTSFEIWEVRFPDGTGELSNYVLAPGPDR